MLNTKKLAQLVEQYRRGDEEAFARVYFMLSKQIYYNAVNILGSENDAGDVLQEVMIRLYHTLPKLQHTKSLQVYIYRMTYNCCMDLLRKRNPIPGGEDMELILKEREESKSEFLPEEYFSDKERQKEILALVNEMKPDLRAVLLLFYYDELSVKEIAHVLEINQHTVKSKLSRARRELRQKLEIDEKSGVLHAVSIPVLTRIFRVHADSLYTSEVSETVWKNVAAELGISVAALGAVSVAVSMGGLGTGSVAVGGIGSKVIFATISIAVVSAVIAVPIFIDDSPVPTNNFAGQSISDASYSGPRAGDSIDSTPDETTPTHVLPQPGSIPPSNQTDAAEAPTSAAEPGGEGAWQTTQQTAVVQVESELLVYARGSLLDRERILRDAGVVLLDDSLNFSDISVDGLEQVNANIPNRYAVEVSVPSGNKAGQVQFVLVIVIEA